MERSAYGCTCEKELSQYSPDHFLSINAVDEAGCGDFRFPEIGIIKTLAASAKHVVAVINTSWENG